MTVVAWDGKTLVSDSLAVAGTRAKLSDYKKIFIPSEGEQWSINGQVILAIGYAGAGDSILTITELLKEGLTKDTELPEGLGDCQVLAVVSKDLSLSWGHWVTEKGHVVTDLGFHNNPNSIGSGSPYSDSVMAIKGSAEMAVKGAIKLDVHSGGNYLQLWDIDNPKEIKHIPISRGDEALATLQKIKDISNMDPVEYRLDDKWKLIKEVLDGFHIQE